MGNELRYERYIDAASGEWVYRKVYETEEKYGAYGKYKSYTIPFEGQKRKKAPVFEPEEIGLDNDQLKRLGIE